MPDLLKFLPSGCWVSPRDLFNANNLVGSSIFFERTKSENISSRERDIAKVVIWGGVLTSTSLSFVAAAAGAACKLGLPSFSSASRRRSVDVQALYVCTCFEQLSAGLPLLVSPTLSTPKTKENTNLPRARALQSP